MDTTAVPAGASRRRVVVTGLGVISSIGTGPGAFARSLREGRSGARPIGAFDTAGFERTNGCEIVDFDPSEWITRLDHRRLGRATQLAVSGARLAIADAGIAPAELRTRSAVISVGTTSGETAEVDLATRRQVTGETDGVDPGSAHRARSGRLSADIARELELTRVEAMTVPTACAAGNYAIGYGFDAVASGEVEVALCGGVEAMVRTLFVAFYRLDTIAADVCRPFDRHRQGILTGEGAAILVLETLDSALARGARIYAEVLGYGLSCDAYHPVAPDRDGVATCIARAHANAGVEPGDVDLISAHGTGTPTNDVTEVAGIREVFGDHLPPTVSIKSMLGHTMGAAGALAAAACVLGLDEGFIPPTINHTETDPDIDIDCVPNRARTASLRVVQNNALAFGGNNAVVVLGRYG